MSDTATKRCRTCGQVKPLSEFSERPGSPDGHRTDCKACRVNASRRYYEANRDARREYQRRRYEEHGSDMRASQRRYRDANRDTVLSYYGRSCACCGATGGLTIDHVSGDGAEHRQALYGDSQQGLGADHFYVWLIKQGFPAGYQTLCRPCNASKKDGPACRLDHIP